MKVFDIEQYDKGKKIYNNKIYVKDLTFNEFKINYYCKLHEVIALRCNRSQDIIFIIQILLISYR
jgi:hypothetical protein